MCVTWWTSGKMGDWPVAGTVVLAAWLPLQMWHAALGRSRPAASGDTDDKPLPGGEGQEAEKPPQAAS